MPDSISIRVVLGLPFQIGRSKADVFLNFFYCPLVLEVLRWTVGRMCTTRRQKNCKRFWRIRIEKIDALTTARMSPCEVSFDSFSPPVDSMLQYPDSPNLYALCPESYPMSFSHSDTLKLKAAADKASFLPYQPIW